jgi:UDP-N-acetyl-2-amino-2-deoxyglucuronate dehydrogenase
MEKIRFAIIGCGAIAARHAIHIQHYGELVAVCDLLEEKALAFANQYQVPYYLTMEELVCRERAIDVVVICTPNGLHAKQSVLALQQGYHVLVEKPMALTATDCATMMQAAADAGRQLFTVMQNRFNPPVQAVKKLLDAGSFGKLYSVQLTCFWNRDQSYYQQSPWRGTKEMDGGVLFTQFSHFIDLLYWFFGEVDTVKSVTANMAHPTSSELEDVGAVVLRFKNGIIGTIHFSVNSFQTNREGSIIISGEKGMVKIGGEYLNTIDYAVFQDAVLPALPAGAGANNYGTYRGSMSNHDQVYQNLIAALQLGSPFYANNIDGLKTVEIIEKIYHAANA